MTPLNRFHCHMYLIFLVLFYENIDQILANKLHDTTKYALNI